MLKLSDITVVYPDSTRAIDALSLTVAAGENVALLGGNGAGKTTLLHTTVGLLDAASGTAEVCGLSLCKKNMAEIRARAGLVFQNPDDQLFMPYVADDVAFGCRNYGLTEQETAARVENTLRQLGILQLKNRSSLKLSGGEKRMAAIAAVLAMEPSLVMFDEPTAFLDPRARSLLAETLRGLAHTKIIATHDMAFAAGVCDRVVVLKDGRVAADGDRSLLYDVTLMHDCGLEAIRREDAL